MPIRNPFARKLISSGLESAQDKMNQPSFERVDTVGSKTSSAMSINSVTSQEPVEYKLSGNGPYSHKPTFYVLPKYYITSLLVC
jgi:hypothetical protein